MRASHEDALFCDMAEYYGVIGFGTLPLQQEALLASRLPANSRTMREISGSRWSMEELLLTAILDQLRVMNWSHTKDAKKKRNFPKSILEEMMKGPEEKKEDDEIETFNSGADFDRRMAQLRGNKDG